MNGGVRRTLLFALLFLTALPAAPAGAGGGCHSGDGPGAGRAVAGTEVQMAMMCFQPRVVAVPPGTTVRFTNQDEVVHVVVGTGWGSGDQLATGQSVEHRFPEAGIYPYSCYLHPGMNGAVVVGDAAPAPVTVPAPTPSPAELAASSTTRDHSAVPLLAVGGGVGAVVGAAVTRRRHRRSRNGCSEPGLQ